MSYIDNQTIAVVLAGKIQTHLLRTLSIPSDANMTNLARAIEDVLKDVVFTYKSRLDSSRDPYETRSLDLQIEYFKHQSATQFSEEIIKKELVDHYKWRGFSGSPLFHIDELTFSVINTKKISEMLQQGNS